MTAMTEQEAATKWCPLARVVSDDPSECGTWNRVQGSDDETKSARCVSARCMAWRFGGGGENVGELDGGRTIWRYHDRGVEQVYIGASEPPEGFTRDVNKTYASRPIPDGLRRGFCGAFEPRVSEVQVANVG